MKLADDTVIAASNSWTWIPDAATATETDEYLIVRFPDYFDHPLEVIRFTPAGPVADAVEMVLDRSRVETSGPILRRAGFAAYGQELIYAVPLGYLRGAGGLAVPPSRWSAVTSPVS